MLHPAPDFVALDWNGTLVPHFGMPLYQEVPAVLARLRAAAIPLLVVSHATQAQIEAEVARCGESFDGVFGCEDKAAVLSDLRLQFGVGALLGDHPADGRAAAQAGVSFLQAALEGQMALDSAAGVFRDWQEVPSLLLVPSRDLS